MVIVGSGGRRGVVGSGGRFGGHGGGGWPSDIGRGGDGGRRRHGLIVIVTVLVVVIVIASFVIITLAIVIRGLWSRRRGGARLDSQVGGRRLGHRGRRRDQTSSRTTVWHAVVPERLALLHGVATIIEELGVVLVLATNSKVTGVVCVIWLRTASVRVNNSTLAGKVTSRQSVFQSAGGALRAAMGALLTAENAARARRARETRLNIAREKKSGGLEGAKR